MALLRQSTDPSEAFVEIPPAVLQEYTRYRPTPLRRAVNFERLLEAKGKIFYKYEGGNISGSHKLNSALAQAFYYKSAGITHLVTGTGAGQWGSALAYACGKFGLRCTVFMVGVSLRQKPQRRSMMELFGATVYQSPSDVTEVGKRAALEDEERIGSLAVATGEALEFAADRRQTRFAVGSGENCVLLHQTVIGVEALAQLDVAREFPTVVVACMGAGSNFGGVFLPFARAARERETRIRFVAAEPTACPKLTRGVYAFEMSDFSGTTPIARMYTLGRGYLPPPIYAGGLRYHGTSPFLSALYAQSEFEAVAITQTAALRAGAEFARAEGILPAPESAHAIAAAINIVDELSRTSDPFTVLINISGHGLYDLTAYERLKAGDVDDGTPDESRIALSLAEVARSQPCVSE